jgi:hypothetical protein
VSPSRSGFPHFGRVWPNNRQIAVFVDRNKQSNRHASRGGAALNPKCLFCLAFLFALRAVRLRMTRTA